MMARRHSVLCLAVRLPTEDGHPIIYTAGDGRTWEHKPGKPPKDLQAKALWDKIDKNWQSGHDILYQAGVALGQWLFDKDARSYLQELRRK